MITVGKFIKENFNYRKIPVVMEMSSPCYNEDGNREKFWNVRIINNRWAVRIGKLGMVTIDENTKIET